MTLSILVSHATITLNGPASGRLSASYRGYGSLIDKGAPDPQPVATVVCFMTARQRGTAARNWRLPARDEATLSRKYNH